MAGSEGRSSRLPHTTCRTSASEGAAAAPAAPARAAPTPTAGLPECGRRALRARRGLRAPGRRSSSTPIDFANDENRSRDMLIGHRWYLRHK